MDRFRLLERIGSGGMGTVYRALDERLQREVAVKEIDGADAERVLREAKAAARLNHPVDRHALRVRVRGPQRAPGLRARRRASRSTRSRREGAMTDRDVAGSAPTSARRWRTLTSAASSTATSSPQNVMVDLAGQPAAAKLMDFGIASIAGEAHAHRPGRGPRNARLHGPRAGRGRGGAPRRPTSTRSR